MRLVRTAVVFGCVLVLCGTVGVSGASAAGTDITVDTFTDEADGSCSIGNCSLRDAISEANALGGGQQVNITLPHGHYYLNAGSLGANEDLNASDDLDFDADVSVVLLPEDGHGAGDTVIFGTDAATPANRHRIFDVSGAASLMIQDIALIDGSMPTSSGGAIRFSASGDLHLERAYIGGNEARYGAAVAVVGPAAPDASVISNSQIENNVASRGGGAVLVSERIVHIARSTLRNNSAGDDTIGGGAIFTEGPAELEVESSLLYDNQATGPGGAIANYGPATVSLANSTFVGNRSDTNDDDSDPFAAVQFGMNGSTYSTRANLFFDNTHLVAGVATALACARRVTVTLITATSLGGNRHDDAGGNCVTAHGTDSMSLSSGQLAVGTIQSHTAGAAENYSLRPGFLPILATSSAIDAADPDLCLLSGDIRGATRSAGTSCDAGSYEFGARTDAGVSAAITTTQPRAGADITMRASITATGAEGLPRMTSITTLGSGVTATAATVPGGSCTIAATVRCVHPVIAAGGQSDATITLTAAAGSYSIHTTHNFHGGDPNSSNATVTVPLEVASAAGTSNPAPTGNPPAGDPPAVIAPRPVLGPYPRPVKHVRGRVKLKVACPAGVTPRCRFTGKLRSAKRVRGAFVTVKCTPLTVAAGRSGTVVCLIAPKQRISFAARAGLRMVFTVTGRSDAPQAATATRAVTIRG